MISVTITLAPQYFAMHKLKRLRYHVQAIAHAALILEAMRPLAEKYCIVFKDIDGKTTKVIDNDEDLYLLLTKDDLAVCTDFDYIPIVKREKHAFKYANKN